MDSQGRLASLRGGQGGKGGMKEEGAGQSEGVGQMTEQLAGRGSGWWEGASEWGGISDQVDIRVNVATFSAACML